MMGVGGVQGIIRYHLQNQDTTRRSDETQSERAILVDETSGKRCISLTSRFCEKATRSCNEAVASFMVAEGSQSIRYPEDDDCRSILARSRAEAI